MPMKVSQITNSSVRTSGLVPLNFSGIWAPTALENVYPMQHISSSALKAKVNFFFFFQKPIYSGEHNTLNPLVQFINLFRIYVSTDMCVYIQCLYGREITKAFSEINFSEH